MNIKNINTHHNKVKTRLVSYNDIGDLSEYLQDLPEKLESASTKRKIEYIASRVCGIQEGESLKDIGSHPNGAPRFPNNYIGSLTHSKDFAVCSRALSSDFLSIGIDIERLVDEKKMNTLEKMVLTKKELLYLKKSENMLRDATIMFSAKESLYKLINPLAQCFINFQEGIVLSINSVTNKADIELKSDKDELKAFLGHYEVFYKLVDNNIFTQIVLK